MTCNKLLDWQKTARPEPTQQDKEISIGIHLEEVSEYLDNLYADNPEDSELINHVAKEVARLSSYIKKGKVVPRIKVRTEHADALGDQIVTAIGDMYNQGMDVIGVLEEINASLWSKFVNGQPVFDKNGKVTKGKNYFKPNLSKFV